MLPINNINEFKNHVRNNILLQKILSPKQYRNIQKKKKNYPYVTTWEFLYIYIYIYNISIRIISFCLLQIFVRCVRAISCQLEILTNLKITDWITNIVSVHNVHISLREYPNIGKTRNLFRCNCTRSLEGRFICLWEQSAACRTFTNPTTSKQLSIQTR